MKEEFKELLGYSHHFNQKLIALLSDNLPSVSERSIQLINHLFDAQQIWNARILNEVPFGVWQINKWEDLAEIDRDNHAKSLKVVEEANLEKVVEYRNSTGAKFSNKIKDILFHIINHSTYHRAQIASDLRRSGIEPINTDYIFYKRQVSGNI